MLQKLLIIKTKAVYFQGVTQLFKQSKQKKAVSKLIDTAFFNPHSKTDLQFCCNYLAQFALYDV